MPQPDDILQRAILDVNKIKQVSLKVAQEKLHQQYSKDLRKKYIQEMQETFGDTDDPTLLEGIFDDQEGGTEEDTPGEIPGQAEAGQPTPGIGAPGDAAATPGGMDNGLPPSPGTASPVVQSDIPTAGVDDTSDGSVIVLTIEDGDTPFDIEASEADLKAQTSELVAGQQGQQSGLMPAEPELGGENAMLPPGEQGRRSEEEEGEYLFAGIFDEEEDPFADPTTIPAMESQYKISDSILLEYIQKSLDNDEKFNALSSTIEKLQSTVDNLLVRLNKSNSDMVNLKEQNIRLMYKNQALNDDSLSEPQKQSIVKALDKAKTLEEAKTVYNTVSATSKTNNKPKDVNAILSDNVTRKFIQESKQPVEEKIELTSITRKLFEKWGI